MKTLKLLFVALMLTGSAIAFSNSTPNSAGKAEAKQNLYENVKNNLLDYDVLNNLESESSEEFIVFCRVNETNTIEITKIKGVNAEVKEEISSIMEKHPVVASSNLSGELIVFKLRLVRK